MLGAREPPAHGLSGTEGNLSCPYKTTSSPGKRLQREERPYVTSQGHLLCPGGLHGEGPVFLWPAFASFCCLSGGPSGTPQHGVSHIDGAVLKGESRARKEQTPTQQTEEPGVIKGGSRGSFPSPTVITPTQPFLCSGPGCVAICRAVPSFHFWKHRRVATLFCNILHIELWQLRPPQSSQKAEGFGTTGFSNITGTWRLWRNQKQEPTSWHAGRGGKMMAASRVRREWKVSLQLHRINQKCLSHRDVVASPST